MWFEGVLAPLGLSPAGATVSLSVDLAFGAFAGHTLLEYRMRDLVCFDRRCSWASTFGRSLSTCTAMRWCCGTMTLPGGDQEFRPLREVQLLDNLGPRDTKRREPGRESFDTNSAAGGVEVPTRRHERHDGDGCSAVDDVSVTTIPTFAM